MRRKYRPKNEDFSDISLTAIFVGDLPSESVKVRHSTLASENWTITWKRCKIGGKLLLISDRKSYMSFRLVPKSVTLNDLEQRNSQPPRNFTEFGSFRDRHDIEVFTYVLRSSQCSYLYFVVCIRHCRKKFTFAISSADEFLVTITITRH